MLFINSLYKFVLATQYVVLKTKSTLTHRYRNVVHYPQETIFRQEQNTLWCKKSLRNSFFSKL